MHTLRLRLALACMLTAAVAPLAAQTATTPATPAPHIAIETVGPDGWRTRYGPTNLGSMLESQKGHDLWQPLVQPLLDLWQHATGDASAFTAARGRVLGYGGRVRFGIWLGTKGIARMVLVLEGDGRTDLKALAADVRELQKQATGKWSTEDVGGTRIDTLHESSGAMTAPFVDGNAIAVAMVDGDGLADAFAHARALAAAATSKPPAPTGPALRVDIDVPALVALAKTQNMRAIDETTEALGYGCLGHLQFTLGTAGPHVQAEIAAQFAPAPKGLFAALCPPVQGVPALQRAVPKQGSWRIGRFDFRALCETVFAMIDSGRRNDGGDTRAEAKKELGIDVFDDLLAHMTDEMLVAGSPLQTIERPEDFTWAIAVRLRDEQKFAQGLDTLLQHAKPVLQRAETRTIEGVECRRYGTAVNYRMWIATGSGTLFVAGGRDAEDRLTELIAAVKKPADAAAPAPAVASAFAELAKHMPPGLNTQASGDIDGIFALPAEVWWMLLEDVLPFGAREHGNGDADERERVRALLKEHNLDVLRTATGYADSTWRWRLFW